MNEITYTPGRLSKKIGISRYALMRHLRDTGLIHQCFQRENGYWQIPYKVVMEIAGPEVLVMNQPPARRRKRTSQTTQIINEQVKQPVATEGSSIPLHRPIRPGVPAGETPAKAANKNRRVDILTRNEDSTEHHTQIGKVLRWAGITMSDLIREYETKNVKEVKNEE